MNKELIVDSIKEWIQLDNELKEIQKASKERRTRKKEITALLVDIMRENEIDCFDVNANEGKLLYTQSKVKTGITKKYLMDTLSNFYKDKPDYGIEVADYILNNREEKIKENIRRKK
jgi:hypothetical protein